MKVLIATVEDLALFAFGALSKKGTTNKITDAFPVLTDEMDMDHFLSQHTLPHVLEEVDEDEVRSAEAAAKNTVMYVGSIDVPLYANPTREFDGMMARLPYGTMVMVLAHQGRWSQVVSDALTGWVLREDLVDRMAHVYPQFVIGESNEADDPNTVRLRAVISDAFGGGDMEIKLTAPEYVTYRLLRRGKKISWTAERSRVAGRWHKLLKGTPGVNIGVKPKTDSIMEFVHPDGTGHLAYIEAVFPDETITLSEADWPNEGVYNERVMTQEEWRELKPVFINIV